MASHPANRQTLGMKLEREYFTPAIQAAVRKARQDGYRAPEILNGIVNAHLLLLKSIFPNNRIVAAFLSAQADHMKRQRRPPVH